MSVISVIDYRSNVVGDHKVFIFTCKLDDGEPTNFSIIIKGGSCDTVRLVALQRLVDRIRDDFAPEIPTIRIHTKTLSSPIVSTECKMIIHCDKKYVQTTYKTVHKDDTFNITTQCNVDIDIDTWIKTFNTTNKDELKHIQMRYLIENPSHGFGGLTECKYCW